MEDGEIGVPGNGPNHVKSIVVLSSYAESLYNFRGDLIRELIAKGWRVHALAPDYDDAKRRKVEALGAIPVQILLQRNGMNPIKDLYALFMLCRLIRTIRPAIFFSYFMKPVIYGAIAAWLNHVPRTVVMVAGLGFVFINANGTASFKKRILRAVVSNLYRFAFNVSHQIIFQNKDDLALMTEEAGAPPARTTLINGSGVNLERFPRREKWEQGETLSFIWTGRLLREKGVVELVEATELLRNQGFEFNVTLVGGTDTNPGSLTAEEVRSWHEKGIVEWVGKVDDVHPYLRRSHVFVLPSYREGLPRSTQEAMATGLAIITTDVPGCRETVTDGVNGILVPARSTQGIVEAMTRYLRDHALVARHGQASRALAESRFDVRVINARMISALLGRSDR